MAAHAYVWIGDGDRPREIRTNEVPLYHITSHFDSAVVTRNNIARIRSVSADQGTTGAGNSSLRISDGHTAGDIGANKVALKNSVSTR